MTRKIFAIVLLIVGMIAILTGIVAIVPSSNWKTLIVVALLAMWVGLIVFFICFAMQRMTSFIKEKDITITFISFMLLTFVIVIGATVLSFCIVLIVAKITDYFFI